MRVTNKGARAFFVLALIAFTVMLCVIGWSMAEAGVNISPYTKKLRQSDVATNFAFIRNDTLFVDSMAVASVKVLKAVALQADTLRGSSTTVGIVDDTLIVDTDSTGSAVTIRFGRWGGGIRWNQATDAMQYTNDFSTWTAIGSGGSSTTNADSLGHKIARVRPLTDGYVLKYDSDGDSLYLSQDATGAAGDSNAIVYSTDRVDMYSDSALYFGDVGDSTMLWYNLTDDNIISFVKVFYNEDVTDSALVTWGSMMAQVGATGSGDITGVITSPPLTGGASSGDVSLGLDWTWLYGFNDTMTARVPLASSSDSTHAYIGNAWVQATNGFVYIDAPSPANGGIFFQVGGNGQLTIDTGSILFSRQMVMNNDTIQDFTGTGIAVSSKTLGLSIPFLYGYVDTTSAKIPTATLADSTNGGAIRATTSKTADSTNGGAIRSETAKTVVHSWLYGYIDTSSATLPRATLADSANGGAIRSMTTKLADSTVGGAVRATTSKTADSTNGGAIRSETAKTVVHSWLYGYIDTSSAIIPRATLADSTNGGAIRATTSNTADSTNGGAIRATTSKTADSTNGGAIRSMTTKLLLSTQGGANTAGRLTLDSLIADTLFATRGNFTNFKVGSDAFITNIAGNALAVSGSTLNAVAGTNNGLSINGDSLYIDTTKIMRTKNLIANWVTPWADSVLGLGSGAGLTIGSSVLLGTDITDDTVLITLPAEWSGSVLSRGYGTDSTKAWDSLTISGGSDIYGNYIQFAKTATTSGTPTMMRRNFQIAIPVPDDADTIYDVSLSYRVQNGQEAESSYVRLKWSTSPFDSSSENTYKTAYTDLDSSNSTTFDTLGTDYNRTAVSRGSKIYALVTALLYDFHTTWARCYDLMVVYHRNRL